MLGRRKYEANVAATLRALGNISSVSLWAITRKTLKKVVHKFNEAKGSGKVNEFAVNYLYQELIKRRKGTSNSCNWSCVLVYSLGRRSGSNIRHSGFGDEGSGTPKHEADPKKTDWVAWLEMDSRTTELELLRLFADAFEALGLGIVSCRVLRSKYSDAFSHPTSRCSSWCC